MHLVETTSRIDAMIDIERGVRRVYTPHSETHREGAEERMADLLATEMARIAGERDLYRRLLNLGTQDALEPFLKEALELIVEISGAERGYLELRDPAREGRVPWTISHSMSEAEVDQVRGRISTGIVASALATGKTVVTNSALLDARFSGRESVQASRIGAVICASVGGRDALGVVYLQARDGAGPFSEEDREYAELFAVHLAPLAERLLARSWIERGEDPTRSLREKYQLETIVGRSVALADVLGQAMLAAPLDVNILLTGDSGTGKTQLARAIHRNSRRSGGPFVELNCAALPDALIENELFGAKAGAHSAAMQDVQGKVAAAEGGTLLLDEIGELPLVSQAKLLQLLQSRSYFPLGDIEARTADIRVIAATNADLEVLVREKRFREDLFFRLHVLAIRLPSVAERREDLGELARAVCARVTEQNGLPSLELSVSALRAIESAEWPGNIRQLESAIASAAIRAAGEGAPEVAARHMFPSSSTVPESDSSTALSFQEATRRFQRDLLSRTLEETNWNVSETARRLDLARSHVYRLIEGFGFERVEE